MKNNLEKFGQTLAFYQEKNSHNTDYLTSDGASFYVLAIQNNLVEVFAKIFTNMDFPDRSVEKLNVCLSEFNASQNNTEILTKNYLLSLGWIRIIFNQVYIPTQIAYSLNSYRQDANQLESPLSNSEKNAVDFLLEYQPDILNKGEISIVKVQNIVSTSICLLEGLDILEKQSDTFIYRPDNYSTSIRHIAKDILINIYYKMFHDSEMSQSKVLEFLNLVQNLDLSYYLPELIPFLREESTFPAYLIELVSQESDLYSSEIEWLKSILDTRMQNSGANNFNNYPNHIIDTTNTIITINRIKYLNTKFDSSYNWQNHRRIYDALIIFFLKLNFFLDNSHLTNYINTSEKPYLTYKIYEILKTEYIEKLPQLILVNNSYIPLIFSEITDLKISESSLLDIKSMSAFSHTEKDKELYKINTELAVTLFKVCFNKDTYTTTCYDISNLAKTLSHFSEQAFNSSSLHAQDNKRIRYEKIIQELEKFLMSIDKYHINNFIYNLVVSIIESFNNYEISHHNLISIDYSIFQLLNDILKIIQNTVRSSITSEPQIESSSNNIEKMIAELFFSHLDWFFVCKEVEVFNFSNSQENTTKEAEILSSQKGGELIDWNLVFMLIDKYSGIEILYKILDDNLEFERTVEYSRNNNDQIYKVELFFKLCCITYIKKLDKSIVIEGFNYLAFYQKIESYILSLANTYNNDDISHDSIFRVPHRFNTDKYDKTARELLFSAINKMDNDIKNTFIGSFFDNSTNIGLMLEAISIIDDENIVTLLSDKISNIEVDDYIEKHVSMIDEIEQSMIYAVNSSSNYHYAKQFLAKVVDHHRNKKYGEKRIDILAKRIELLLALKEKDVSKIISFRNDSSVGLTSFVYEAVYRLDEECNFDKAEELLRCISETEAFDIGARLDLFRCILYNTNKTIVDNYSALNNWNEYVASLEEKSPDNDFLSKFSGYINSLKAIAYGQSEEEKDSFYECFRLIDNDYRYDKYLLPVVIDRLTSDKRFIEYNIYINEANEYYIKTSVDIPDILSQAINENLPSAYKRQVRQTLNLIQKMKPKDIIHVLPNNNINDLNEFVIACLLSSLKMMMEKIHSIREKQADGSYKLENQYNDLLNVILTAKIEHLNWQVTDQERVGLSAANRDAGEADLIIQHSNNKFALIEAFRLKGKDKSTTQSHSSKVHGYTPNIENYYNLIYYIGNDNVDTCWSSYKEDFLTTDFPVDLRNPSSFEELTDRFSDIQKMRVAKTIHGRYNYFHIIVDLSDYGVCDSSDPSELCK